MRASARTQSAETIFRRFSLRRSSMGMFYSNLDKEGSLRFSQRERVKKVSVLWFRQWFCLPVANHPDRIGKNSEQGIDGARHRGDPDVQAQRNHLPSEQDAPVA